MFPGRIRTDIPDQVLLFGSDGPVRRHDYGREPDGTTMPELAFVTIDTARPG